MYSLGLVYICEIFQADRHKISSESLEADRHKISAYREIAVTNYYSNETACPSCLCTQKTSNTLTVLFTNRNMHNTQTITPYQHVLHLPLVKLSWKIWR
jgi:hypothetical protein